MANYRVSTSINNSNNKTTQDKTVQTTKEAKKEKENGSAKAFIDCICSRNTSS
jgi:hypothetical protein